MARFFCACCNKPKNYCYCRLLNSVTAPYDILILRHPSEAKHALGTALMVSLGLTNASLIDVSDVDTNTALVERLSKAHTYLIFPAEVAQPFETWQAQQADLSLSDTAKPTLVFLDGSWRKAKRLWYSSRCLQQLPTYQLTQAPPSRYKIRHSHYANSLSTLEAVVACLQLSAGPTERYQNLLDTMDWMIERQIAAMGLQTYLTNYVNKP